MEFSSREFSVSWEPPKTDWYGETDSGGNYKGDRFNNEDYNRIKNNLIYLKEVAIAMYPEFLINQVGNDKGKADYFYADEIAQLQENIEIIAKNTIGSSYGDYPTYIANGKIFDFNELNRIESAIQDLYNKLVNQYKGRQMLTFMFGVRREVF